MLYFSELYNKKVYTKDKLELGRLKDFIFLASENSLITKIVIENKKKEKEIISSEYLIKIDEDIFIEKNYLTSYLEENELYLVKNLLDKQIIDIKGNKIVRVNDVVINKNNNQFFIFGVDIGFIGILRRIRIFNVYKIYNLLSRLNIRLTSKFLSWADIQPLELARGQVKLKRKEEKLKEIRPEDLADYLERINLVNTKKILKILDIEKAAEVISNLNINYQTALFRNFKPETSAKFLKYIDPDEAVDVFLTLSKKKQEAILEFLDKNTKNNILKLLELSKNPIGALITTEYLYVYSDNSVRQVIDKIKKETKNFSVLDYIYVVNKKDELVGVFSLHEMILKDLDTPVYKFMIQNVIVIHLTTPQNIAIKKMLKYKLYALPVIDENKKILGIITLDDLTDNILEKI
ncbi:MAG: CBS domain-containing protein [Patescibacteria group bacterium]|nr:CBS domain-containing protein [Patescibacteria group bacterium]